MIKNFDGEGLIKTERIEKESLVDHHTTFTNHPNIGMVETNVISGAPNGPMLQIPGAQNQSENEHDSVLA